MPDFPDVTVLICTFNRPDEIARTVEALRANLSYPDNRLHWIVADDHSPDGYVTKLKRSRLFKDLQAQFVVTEQNGGWGVNVNNGMRAAGADYILFLEDDKLLRQPLDLRVGVALMESKPDIGMVRYRGTAGDHVVFDQLEADISPLLPDHQSGVGLPGKLTYLQLDSGSPSLWLYSNGMHLKHRRFHDFYGAYPEGLKLGSTEESMCHHVKNRMRDHGAPAIVILPEWVNNWSEDIGKTYQGTEADR